MPSPKTKPNSTLKKFHSIKVPESKFPSDGGGGTWLEQFVVKGGPHNLAFPSKEPLEND